MMHDILPAPTSSKVVDVAIDGINYRTFFVDFQVRGYELDGYGMVNHANYLHYGEYARWRMIEDSGAGSDIFRRHGLRPVIGRAEVAYRDAVLGNDWLRVETRLRELSRKVAKFEHKIFRKSDSKLMVELLMSILVIDSSGRATSLPADFANAFGPPHP